MKYMSFFSALFLLSLTSLNAQERFVLYEEFTSETCPPSRPVDSALWALLNTGSNPDKIQYITFVTPYPAMGGLYKSAKIDYQARSNYYAVPFVSYGRLDGQVHNTTSHVYKLKQPQLDSAAAIPSPFNILPTCEYNNTGDSVSISATISCLSDFAPPAAKMKLYIAFVRTLDYTTPPGSNGQTHFENMVRKMYPNANGTPIDSVWFSGDAFNFHLKVAIPSEAADSLLYPHVSSPGHFALWIQNDMDKVVAQSAKAIPTIPAPPTSNSLVSIPIQGLRLFPNPTNDLLNVTFTLKDAASTTISVVDISGRTVIYRADNLPSGTRSSEIPTDLLANGVYSIRIHTHDMTLTHPFVVAH